jgi:hypothetical protein
VVNRWRAIWDFDSHGGGVYVDGFTIDHAGAVALTFDRKAVRVPKLIEVLLSQIKYFRV